MKRYLLFAGEVYYPSGGVPDLHGDFDTLDEAKAVFSKDGSHWANILDTEELKTYEWIDLEEWEECGLNEILESNNEE